MQKTNTVSEPDNNGSKHRGRKVTAFLAVCLLVIAALPLITDKKPGPEPLSREVIPSAIKQKDLAVGDEIVFGTYEQDNDPDNGREAILWQVLKVENDRALLISKYALDAKPYNDKWTRVTWESSFLRNWLNGEFYSTAFDTSEQKQILTVTNINPDNPVSRIKGGRDTRDQVFLLSIDEAHMYLTSDSVRQCSSTAYAKANSSYVNEYQDDSWWWLRTRGATSKTASLVLYSGYINTVGYGVNNNYGDVRPALWLSL